MKPMKSLQTIALFAVLAIATTITTPAPATCCCDPGTAEVTRTFTLYGSMSQVQSWIVRYGDQLATADGAVMLERRGLDVRMKKGRSDFTVRQSMDAGTNTATFVAVTKEIHGGPLRDTWTRITLTDIGNNRTHVTITMSATVRGVWSCVVCAGVKRNVEAMRRILEEKF